MIDVESSSVDGASTSMCLEKIVGAVCCVRNREDIGLKTSLR